MNRGLGILGIILLAGVVVYLTAFHFFYAHTHALATSDRSELEWLRYEFGLSEHQFQTINKLHGQHDVKCLEFCDALEKGNVRLLRMMRESTEITPGIESALQEATKLRERCRRTTLQHIYEVSLEMPPEAGKRYREMMTARLVDSGLHHQTAVSRDHQKRHDKPDSHHP